jgi:hypothetical protein
MRWLFLALAACGQMDAVDEGLAGVVSGPEAPGAGWEQAPPPSGGNLQVSAAVPGNPLRLVSDGHPAGARVFFGRGGVGTTCPSTLGGQCLDLGRAALLGDGSASAAGRARLELPVPGGLPLGRSTGMQAANTTVGGTVVISNRVEVRVEEATCRAGLVQLVRNAAFELPLATGEQRQAYGGRTLRRMTDPVTASQVIEVTGNEEVTWDLVPTPVATLASVDLWTWHDPTDAAIQSWTAFYASGRSSTGLVINTTTGTGWEKLELLAQLDATEELTGFQIWGYSGGGGAPDLTRYDDLMLCGR